MRYIKRNILIVILMVTIFLLTGCGKSYEKKIEEKYGIGNLGKFRERLHPEGRG